MPAPIARRDLMVTAAAGARSALAGVLHFAGAAALVDLRGLGRGARRHRLPDRRIDRPARQPPDPGRDRHHPVGGRQPARALRLHLRAPGRARHRRPGLARRLDPLERAPRPRPRLPRRRLEPRRAALRRPGPADDREPAHARGRRDDAADARPRAAPAGERARAGPLGRLRAGPAHRLRGPDPGDAEGVRPRRCRPRRTQRDGIWPLPRAIGVLVAAASRPPSSRNGSSTRSSRRSRCSASARPSPASSSSRSPATRSSTPSASSSPSAARPSSRSASSSTARCRSRWRWCRS